MNLLNPDNYVSRLEILRQRNKYAKNWKLRLEKKTNRHPNCDGTPWGWYEIFPLGITVGHWSGNGKDDLAGIDINQWLIEKLQEVEKRPDLLWHRSLLLVTEVLKDLGYQILGKGEIEVADK